MESTSVALSGGNWKKEREGRSFRGVTARNAPDIAAIRIKTLFFRRAKETVRLDVDDYRETVY